MKNRLIIAGAGTGKTTYIVNEAMSCKDRLLITTFTEKNEEEIKKKFREINRGIIPDNITIQTWFSFLIEHGVKPYQGKITEKKINGLLLVNERSGIKYKDKAGKPRYYGEDNVDKFYFTEDYRIYSDKLSKFVVKSDELNNGNVIKRISSIFKKIYIDEVQDLAGYDLEIIKLLMKSDSWITLVGDPRQVTYHTHFSRKYKKYNNGKIRDFIINECKKIQCVIDTDTLSGSHRNNKIICDFANKVFPDLPAIHSNKEEITRHEGVFLVKEKDAKEYIMKYDPLQLRYDRKKKIVTQDQKVMTYGESKGITVDRTLIYPTKNILSFILEGKELSSFETKCKLYVALTRAKYSVAIICPDDTSSETISVFNCVI